MTFHYMPPRTCAFPEAHPFLSNAENSHPCAAEALWRYGTLDLFPGMKCQANGQQCKALPPILSYSIGCGRCNASCSPKLPTRELRVDIDPLIKASSNCSMHKFFTASGRTISALTAKLTPFIRRFRRNAAGDATTTAPSAWTASPRAQLSDREFADAAIRTSRTLW